MFDAIDNYARSIAIKLSNWVLNLPFWPEGLVGERLLRYILLGLLALGHVLLLSSYWGMSGSAVQGYFEFQGGMFAWWLLYELEDVKPPRKKRPRKDSAWKPSFGIPWNVSHNLWR